MDFNIDSIKIENTFDESTSTEVHNSDNHEEMLPLDTEPSPESSQSEVKEELNVVISSSEVLSNVVPPMEEEVGDYYFESDSLALKGNKDYRMLIKALVKLESQRAQSVKNLEHLKESKEQALQDPLGLVRSLQNGEDLGLPNPIQIASVPVIDWEKYNVQSIVSSMRPATRKNFRDSMKTGATSLEGDLGHFKPGELPTTTTSNYHPWSKEEQRKLEELLIKYPQERISSRRWEKISKELGTRTPLQVQSRTQKFFIALKKKGLPIPGKVPSATVVRPVSRGRRRGGLAKSGDRSMFIQAFDFETPQADSSGRNDPRHSTASEENRSLEVSDEEDICDSLKDSEEYQELIKLKKVKKFKLEEAETGIVYHYGFECDSCGANPIKGTRWHCKDCSPSVSTDLCHLCIKSSVEANGHHSLHSLEPIKNLCIKQTLTSL